VSSLLLVAGIRSDAGICRLGLVWRWSGEVGAGRPHDSRRDGGATIKVQYFALSQEVAL